MSKFAKLMENEAGQQLLICVVNSDESTNRNENKAIEFTFEDDDAYISVKISSMSYEDALQYIEDFTQDEADEILNDSYSYFLNN